MLIGRYLTALLFCITLAIGQPSIADTQPAHQTQSITVVHVDPVDILTTMKWTTGNFPTGVDAIAADKSSLKVTGTDTGIGNVRAAVDALDVEAKNVYIAFQLILVRRSDIDSFGIDYGTGELPYKMASGNLIEKMRAQLAVKPNLLSNPSMIVKNGNESSMLITSDRFPGLLPLASMQLNVSPRVNQDGTITLTINPRETFVGANAIGPVRGSKNVTLTRRLHDGGTMVAWDSTGLAGVDGAGNCLLIFVRASVQK
jgi:hypothetical protein